MKRDEFPDWDLTSISFFRETSGARLYRAEDANRRTVIVKQFFRTPDEEIRSSAALRSFPESRSVRLLRQQLGWQLLEYVAGHSLCQSEFATSDSASLEITLELIANLHRPISDSPEHLPTLDREYASLLQADPHLLPLNWRSLYRDAISILTPLLARSRTSVQKTALHGDLHPQNILFAPRGWIAIDPKGVYGEAVFDTANLFYNSSANRNCTLDPNRAARLSEQVKARLGFDRQLTLSYAFTYGLLKACWHIEDDQDPKEVLEIAQILRNLL